jgi:peptidoglycan/LPS O-acetylase OafA/YrhL
MQLPRRALLSPVLALALLAAAAGVALAASLSMASNSLGAASASTPRCTAAGLGVLQVLSGSNVASVTVSGLPSGCGGAALQATLNNGTTSSSGSITVPAGGGSVTVTLASAIAIGQVDEIDLVLTGP